MNSTKYNSVFLVIGVIYFIDGISTLVCRDCHVFNFLGYSISKTQELFRQFITAFILSLAYWKLKHK